MTIYLKTCCKCKIEKPITEYHKSKAEKDGHCYKCKSCSIQSSRDQTKRRRELKKLLPQTTATRKNRVKKPVRSLEEKRAIAAKRQRDRRAEDPLFKLKCNIRTLICNTISARGHKKSAKAEEILGCSFIEFMSHIESKFLDGMSWKNRHLWVIDHNIPIAWAETEEEIIALNHYTNLQPLWISDNIRKGSRYAGDNKTIIERHIAESKLKIDK